MPFSNRFTYRNLYVWLNRAQQQNTKETTNKLYACFQIFYSYTIIERFKHDRYNNKNVCRRMYTV